MKSLKENALVQEMNVEEMTNVNGGSLLVAAAVVAIAALMTTCSNNSVHISIGHGTGNNVAVGDSIQNK